MEHPKPQRVNQSQRAKRSPSHTDNDSEETNEYFGGEKGKVRRSYRPLQDEPEICTQKITYTAEPEAVQVTFPPRVTRLHETTQRQGGKLGWVASGKSLPKDHDKAKPGAERSQTAPSRLRSEPQSSSISGFSFTTNGGSMHNQNVGVIYRAD